MKKYILLFLIIIFCSFEDVRSQNCIISNNLKQFDLCQNVDSVVVSYEVSYDKETSSEFEDASNHPSFKKSRKLNQKDIDTLRKYLLSQESYSNDVSGLSHSDIYIYYYRNGLMEKVITISSISRNINFIRNDNFVQKSISGTLEEYLSKLLKKKGIWAKTKTFYQFD